MNKEEQPIASVLGIVEGEGDAGRVLSDLTRRQDNVIWIVREQKGAHFLAGRGRTTMIENRSHSFKVGIMMGHSFVKSHIIHLLAQK